MAHVLWTRHLKFDPADPAWPDRDRFVLSAGHGSMLLYALLHLSGYGLAIEELEAFRQWGSRTPGHPEYGLTPGVETTTGPLGAGFSNGVGMAIAEAFLAATFNRPGYPLVDHRTFGIVSDGDLMEGVAAEAASLAGHLGLGKLIYLYDDNHISIEGCTDLAFTEDVGMRFEAYGWQVLTVDDGNDLAAIDGAIAAACAETSQALAHQGPHRHRLRQPQQGRHRGVPRSAAWARRRSSSPKRRWAGRATCSSPCPKRVRRQYASGGRATGRRRRARWEELLAGYERHHPDLGRQWDDGPGRAAAGGLEGPAPRLRGGRERRHPVGFGQGAERARAGRCPLSSGARPTWLPRTTPTWPGWVTSRPDAHAGRNLRFGVREHAMGGILNGMACARGPLPLRGHVLRLLRLHAAGHPAGRSLPSAGDLRLHPRQHRSG